MEQTKNEATSCLPSGEEKPLRFGKRELAALGMGIVLALLWFRLFSLENLLTAEDIPGLGIPVLVSAFFAAVFIYLGREARFDKVTVLLLAAVAALSVCCFVFGDRWVRVINCLLIVFVSFTAVFRVAGKSKTDWNRADIIGETVILTVSFMFCHVDKPFRAAARGGSGRNRVIKQLALGVAAALPVLAVVLALLMSADSIFGNMLSGLADSIGRLNPGKTLWKILRTAVLALLAFSGLYALREPAKEKPSEPVGEKNTLPALPFATVLVLMDIVYLLFAVIQFAYLFGGGETAAMEGGYAEYARSGFFQLVAVAAINLAAVLFTAQLGVGRSTGVGKTVLRVLSFLLLALTAVILVSAAWRMRLYIMEYGLSLLRAMTLWAMSFIAVCLIAAGVKLIRPGFRFFGVFFALGLAGWIVFNCVNIDARIAEYNVEAYISGQTQHMDTVYLKSLGADSIPALMKLEAVSGEDYGAVGFINSVCDRRNNSTWAEQNLSWWRYID